MAEDQLQQELIRAVNISKSFQNSKTPIHVLDRMDISIRRSETLAIVGASGIGKSTLLHILGTLDRPDHGQIYFEGEEISRYDDQRLARFRNQTMGFVFQFHHLLPEFSAIENVMMPAMIQGREKRMAEQAAGDILERVGLSHRLHQKATELSGGEQQRVALARALILKPSILFADEPTGNLDRDNSEQIHQLLLDLNSEMDMAMIVVTHNTALAELMMRQATITNGKLAYR